MKDNIKILYISPGPVPPENNRDKNKFYFLSEYFSGDVLSPVWWKKSDLKTKERIRIVHEAMGRFQWHTTFSSKYSKLFRFIWDLLFYLTKGLQLHFFKERKFDIIVSYGIFKTGLAAYLLKKFTGRKLIIELPGNPQKVFTYEAGNKIINNIKEKLIALWSPFILNRADYLKSLYPEQLNGYPGIKNKKIISFHNFVPINSIRPDGTAEPYILFIGHPWYLKGVDVLIQAFNKISKDFPKFRLKIVGYCPDKIYFAKLADGNKDIELLNAVFHEKAMEMMGRCYLFVLPSRTEAMGRVLLEAMAMGKPIIASRVDGIPNYIQNGYNGLLFESENNDDLAEKIARILENEEYAKELGRNGYDYVKNYLSETIYIEKYYEMVKEVLGR
jgi:glycosyltransferase involved in cell wall biosynthesis